MLSFHTCSTLVSRRTYSSIQHLLLPSCQRTQPPSGARGKVAMCQAAAAKVSAPNVLPMGNLSLSLIWCGLRAPTELQCWQWRCSSVMGAMIVARSPRQSCRLSARVRFTNACGECFAPERTAATLSQTVSLQNTRRRTRDPMLSVLSNAVGIAPCLACNCFFQPNLNPSVTIPQTLNPQKPLWVLPCV